GVALQAARGAVLVNGAGATFPYPIYSKWFDEFHKRNPDVQINYQSIGSGGGIRQVTDGTVDFGASDGPMTDEQLAATKVPILHLPTVLGAVVPTFNLAGVETLRFTPEALAGIFLGRITRWDDAALAEANPGVKLPGQAIVPVHRSDGSGTTYVFTDYLAKVSPEWSSSVGKGTAVNWPVGIGGKGNEGVAGLVKQTPNTIGYVELVYAVQNKLPVGAVRNRGGRFVQASLDSIAAAARASRHAGDRRAAHFVAAARSSLAHGRYGLPADVDCVRALRPGDHRSDRGRAVRALGPGSARVRLELSLDRRLGSRVLQI